jgi:hypothetical protein
MPPSSCTACFDEDVCFECVSVGCEYQLCHQCVLLAFQDVSGHTSRICPLCNEPSAKAMAMAIATIGEDGVLEAERELRPSVEHQGRTAWSNEEDSKMNENTTNEKVLQMYNSVVESLNLTCPRCKMVFDDYDGCHALTCGNVSCYAKFCAICLEDCGQDAHTHVQEMHGDLHGKNMFYESRDARAKKTISDFLAELREKGESFEVIQLVENELRKGGHPGESHQTGTNTV